MPQMMPMLWMNLYIILILIILMTYTNIYFMNYYIVFTQKIIQYKKWNWKW